MLKNNIRNENSLNESLENSSTTYQKAKKLQTKLLFYPIVIFIVYLCNFIGRIRYHVTEKDNTLLTILLIAVLVFLNIYCSTASQQLFYRSKQASMQDKVQLVASSIGQLDVMNHESVTTAVENLNNLNYHCLQMLLWRQIL
jgi:hypothetical protein